MRKKILLVCATLMISSAPAWSEDIATTGANAQFDKAYAECSQTAEANEDKYDEIFSACMKEKGMNQVTQAPQGGEAEEDY